MPNKHQSQKNGRKQKSFNDGLDKFREKYFPDAFRPNTYRHILNNSADSRKLLLDSLQHPVAENRIDALRALGKIFDDYGAQKEDLDRVVEHSKQIPEDFSGERQAAYYAIGKARNESLLKQFVQLLMSNNPKAVEGAASIYGHAQWKPALPYLVQVAQTDNDYLSPPAIWALGELRDRKAVPVLILLLEAKKYPAEIFEAFGKIADPLCLSYLADGLKHPQLEVKRDAAAALLFMINNEKNENLRSLFKISIPALHQAVLNDDKHVAATALFALAQLGEELDRALVEKVFELGKHEAREFVATTLSRRIN